METPDLSSLGLKQWELFCRAPGAGRFNGYAPEVGSYEDDLVLFKCGVETNNPRAIYLLTEFVLWRMNNNQGEQHE